MDLRTRSGSFVLILRVRSPITPASPGPNTNVEAPFIDVTGFGSVANSPRYNSDRAPVYPGHGDQLSTATDCSWPIILTIASVLSKTSAGARKLIRVNLRRNADQFVYPYSVVVAPRKSDSPIMTKVYVSCWNDNSIAVVDPANARVISRVQVGRHPTAMLLNPDRIHACMSQIRTTTVFQ